MRFPFIDPQRAARVFLALLLTTLAIAHYEAFRIPFFGEDFVWLYTTRWQGTNSLFHFREVGFYRPLSVNIPYFVFTQLPDGLYFWKAISFLVFFGTIGIFLAWSKEILRSNCLALVLAALWSIQPHQYYGLSYANAFDYLVSPFFLLLFLRLLQVKRWRTSFVAFLLACFSKEFFFALPIFYLLWRRRYGIPSRWFWCSLLFLLLYIPFTHGLNIKEGIFLGERFTFSPQEIFSKLSFLIQHTFISSSGTSLSRAWYYLGWLFVVLLAVAGTIRFDAARLKNAAGYLGALLVFFLPLAFIPRIEGIHFDSFYWIFIFGAAMELAGPMVVMENSTFAPLFLGCAVFALSGFGFANARLAHADFGQQVHRFEEVRSAVHSLLAGCAPGKRIVIDGLPQYFNGPHPANDALWMLRWMRPDLTINLLFRSGLPDFLRVAHPGSWTLESELMAEDARIFMEPKPGSLSLAAHWIPGHECMKPSQQGAL